MTRWVVIFVLLTIVGCRKEVDREDCTRVCTNLAKMLQADRVSQGQHGAEGLQSQNTKGLHNIERCVMDCEKHSDEDQLECLNAAQNLQAWQACD